MKLAVLSRHDSDALLVGGTDTLLQHAGFGDGELSESEELDGGGDLRVPIPDPFVAATTSEWKAEWLRLAEEAGRQRRSDAEVAALAPAEINALSGAYFDALGRCMCDLRALLHAGGDLGDFKAICILVRAVEALHEQRRLTQCHGWDVLTSDNRAGWCRCERAWGILRTDFSL